MKDFFTRTKKKDESAPRVGVVGNKVITNPSSEQVRRRTEQRLKTLEAAHRKERGKPNPDSDRLAKLDTNIRRHRALKEYYDLGGKR